MSIDQKLNILARGSKNFSFSIANFTKTSQPIQPDTLDVTYLSLNSTALINTTWSPVIRSTQPGNYYLLFLARNASMDSPARIMANVTKTWTDIETYGVLYVGSLLDSSFSYIGLGIVLFGGAISLIAFLSRHHPRNR